MVGGAPKPLADHHVLDAFDCGEEHLNSWLQHRARRNEGKFARTFVVSADGHRVIGYYCLAAGSLRRSDVSKPLQRNAPEIIPVIMLGRFAVDLNHQRQGIGTLLLHDAMRRALGASLAIGARGILIHAKDVPIRDYYMQFGFQPMVPKEPLSVLLRIESIANSLESD